LETVKEKAMAIVSFAADIVPLQTPKRSGPSGPSSRSDNAAKSGTALDTGENRFV
jgi:hypothetical protein